ncbi:unnamed protein product [Calicophoron daubneyi]|uniref:DUF2452 domain-containing protein n=1 Tax=Calicophoron daubneyi TaxID=300641 RepID=A0AAV2T7T9_CALDB
MNSSSEAQKISLDLMPGQLDICVNADAKKPPEPEDLVELAKQIECCQRSVQASASSRLHVIVKQMQYLKEQAEIILKEAQRDVELHKIPCNFLKKPGNVYYVYVRKDGSKFFSMLSPQEWGPSCPATYSAAYKLMPDMTWIPEDEFTSYQCTDNVVQNILCKPNFLALNNEKTE